jgi:glycosyltransferase involved in cell wall biosynthesis
MGSRQPRVLELIFGNTLGGAEVLLREMMRAADHSRFEWHVAVMRRQRPFEEYEALRREVGFHLHLVPCGSGYDSSCTRRLVRLMREHAFDVVHTHLFRADLHGRIAARRAGVPVVVSTIHVFRSARTRWLRDWLDRRTARHADRIIGCTETVSALSRRRLRLPPERVVTIPNGLPLARFLEPRDAQPLRAELGIAEGEQVIGTIGRLNPEKNHADFLRMAALLVKRRPELRFVIVGEGGERARLERLAGKLGVADRVIFTGARSDVPELLALFNAFVLCSLWEALPMTLLEAMAAGTPVAAADVGGCPDVVHPGETGWLVPPGDPLELAAAVDQILDNADDRRRITERARRFVVERHAIERCVRAHEELFEHLLREKHTRPG